MPAFQFHHCISIAVLTLAFLPLGSATAASSAPPPLPTLALVTQTTIGGPDNEIGTGIAVDNSGVYFSGFWNGGVVGKFSHSLGSSPIWIRSWANPSDSSQFNGVSLINTGAITVGYSYAQTVDLVGGKEIKGIAVNFNADGSQGGGFGGSVWSKQTPAAPGAYSYGGIEWLTGVATDGGSAIYTAGLGQDSRFFNLGLGTIGRFITKLDNAGNIMWTRTDDSTIVAASSSPLWHTRTTGLAATGDHLYVASRIEIGGGVHPDLKKYDSNGNLLWTRTSAAPGEYRAVAHLSGSICAVGQTNPDSFNQDFLIECWDYLGHLIWSKTYDRSSAEDVLNAVAFTEDSSRLIAVGSTEGGTAGGKDAVVLELDFLTGKLLSTTLWGGGADDEFTGVAVSSGKVFALGSTKSFGAGGSDIAVAVFQLPAQPPVNSPPIAHAGVAQAVQVGATVSLSGAASRDPDGDPLTFLWQILERPTGSSAALVGAATATPKFVADLAGSYLVKLVVADPSGASSSAAVRVTASTNRPPVAVIAPVSGKLNAPAEKVLDGRGSSDPDGDKISFNWRLVSKPAASKRAVLIGATRFGPTLFMDVVGDYVVELTVWDTKGLSGKTQRTITALGAGAPPVPQPPPPPVSCAISSGFAPGTSDIVQYVECDGKQVSPYAYNSTSHPGQAMQFIRPIPGMGGVGLTSNNQAVAYWVYETVSTTGFSPTRTTYEANCTRNPQATPISITGLAQRDSGPGTQTDIRNFKVTGLVATSKLCEFGTGNCTNYTKLLPSGCSTR